MILLILLTVLISVPVFSQPEDCADGILTDKMFREIAIPNCTQDQLVSKAIRTDSNRLCNDCKSDFQKKSSLTIPSRDPKSIKKQFIEAAFNEYQKNLTDNMLQTLKLRAVKPTGSSYANSSKACALKSKKDFSSKCSKESLNLLDGFIKNFQSSISTELAKLLATDKAYTPNETLLKRTNSSCFIPEKDILLVNAKALEDVLDFEAIKIFSSLNPNDYDSLDDLYLDEKLSSLNNGDFFGLIGPIKSHPLLSEYAKNPKTLINFFKSIQDPKDNENLLKKLYSKQTGDDFDLKLAKSCQESFEALDKAICSDEFNNGDITLDAFKNHNQLFSKAIETNSSEFANSDDLIQKNLSLLSLCDTNPMSGKNLTAVNDEISKNLEPSFAPLSLDQYLRDKYEKDIGQANVKLCNELSICDKNTFHCKMIENYKRLKDSSSTESKLANSSNSEVNALLRSMIGDSTKIDPKTREILVTQGILPKADGTIVEQASIPERRADFVQKAAAVAAPTTTVAKASSGASRSQVDRGPASSQNTHANTYTTPMGQTASSNFEMPDFSDLMKGQDSELKEIQDEIRRRLMDLPEKRPTSVAQAKQIAKSSFEKSGQKLTPFQEARFAERMMQPQSNTEALHESSTSPNRAGVSDAETQLEKWKNSQMDQALAGMAGAQQVANRDIAGGSSSASASNPKELTKVALNITEDPKVTLSELFSSKLHNNDSETQLLKVLMANKSNFLLQVKGASFKVVFDENNNYNLLFDSGNKQEAEKIRPQLEIFLRRLKK